MAAEQGDSDACRTTVQDAVQFILKTAVALA
jgi:hypothetical protein